MYQIFPHLQINSVYGNRSCTGVQSVSAIWDHKLSPHTNTRCTGVTPIKKKILIDVEHHIDCSSIVYCLRQGQCDKIGIFKSSLVAKIEPSLLRTQVTILQTIELLSINIRAVTHSIKVPFHFLYCKDIIQLKLNFCLGMCLTAIAVCEKCFGLV